MSLIVTNDIDNIKFLKLVSHERKIISMNETRTVLTELKKANVVSSLKPTKSPTETFAPKITSIGKDNVNVMYHIFLKSPSKMLKRIPKLLKNNFNDNKTNAVSSNMSRRSNDSSENVVGIKKTGLSTDNSMGIPVKIDSLSGWLMCYVKDFMLPKENQNIRRVESQL